MVDMSVIFGRDFDRETIVSRLQSESSKQEDQVAVPIISIVGMGGLGKTTLAQIIYNEDTKKTSFELRMWVCVSEPFDLKRVAKEILEQAGEDANIQDLGLEALHQRLRGCVQGRRFLLVLDDVWSEDPNAWNPLKLSLYAGERGSGIIITTRNVQVANMVGSTYIHKLGQLSDGDSYSLFRKIAFSGRSPEELRSFEEIAKDIARKCKGIPLAVKSIASLMRLKRTKQDWRNVLVNFVWDVQLVEKSMLPALLLSYYALPSHLKQCFTYCAIFPKDSRLEKNELVQLWMAQGYLGLDDEKELEVIGVEFFEDLAMRSFFQDFKFDDEGNIIACRMHDLVHDLAHFLTKTECLVLESNDMTLRNNDFRHIHADRRNIPRVLKARNLRSLFIITELAEDAEAEAVEAAAEEAEEAAEEAAAAAAAEEAEKAAKAAAAEKAAKAAAAAAEKAAAADPALVELCSQLKYLRVLSLPYAYLIGVTDVVGSLIHLRFLDLSGNYALQKLPEAMCNLTNLHTLKLNNCRKLCKLPEGIGELSKLRHLEIQGTELFYFPQSIGKLSRLRTLCKFIVGGGRNGCSIGELRSLNQLGGTLKLVGLMNVQNVEEANQAEMKKKSRLSCLWLYFGYEIYDEYWEEADDYSWREINDRNVGEEEAKRMEGVLQVLQPNANLEELVIKGYPGVMFPFWMSGKLVLSNVVKLELQGCLNCIQLPALGNLESLESLSISDFDALKHIGSEFYGVGAETSFPKLKELGLYEMTECEYWEIPFSNFKKFEVMPHLIELEVSHCRKLKAVPAGLGKLQSLESLKFNCLDSVKHLGADLFGISGENAESADVVLFPKLTRLEVCWMTDWEEDEDKRIMEAKGTRTVATTASIMPGLKELEIMRPDKLKVLPHHILSYSLRKLTIYGCPALTGSQPCLPPLLEHLKLYGDVGILSKSLIPITAKDNNYPNLKSLAIYKSPHYSLPEGLSKFTSLQLLEINSCMYLDFKPELIHLPILQELEIRYCPNLSERCNKEDWKNKLSHQISYNIVIDSERIIGTKRH